MYFKPLALALGFSLTANCFASSFFEPKNLSLELLGSYSTGVFDDGAAEIVAHDVFSQRLFVVNANAAQVDVLDIKNPAKPTKVGFIDASNLGGGINSVAVKFGIVAVAIEADVKQDAGVVAFYKASDLSLIHSVAVGALPDMVTFSPNGRYVVVANEGEPNDDYSNDPEGSVSIIDLLRGVKNASVRTADFTKFNGMEDALRAKGIRIFGPGASAAKDLEPEYVTISKDSKTAYVSIQEANALAVIDIKRAEVVELLPLGTKDHGVIGNELDASNKDGGINIQTWPVKGLYMPDSIDSYSYRGETYIVLANEGDSRDYDGFSEEARIKDLDLDPSAFPNASVLQQDENLGRLKTTVVNGDVDGDGDYDELYSYGARSFSIRNSKGEIVYDSGSEFELILAERLPEDFNSGNDENNSFDDRSDDKGAEPEAVEIASILGRTYAFIGLERVGGIMIYDISNPHQPSFVNYVNNRNFGVEAQLEDGSTNPAVGDLGVEGLLYIPFWKSPVGRPLLVSANEISGTTTIFKITLSK